MKHPIAFVATFGLVLIAVDVTSAQDYACPFGRGNSYVPANIDRAAEYPESYGLSECRDGACPYAQHLARQSRSYQSQPELSWSRNSQFSPNRIPADDWRDDRRLQTYDLRSDDRRLPDYDLRDSYSRNDFSSQFSTYGSQRRYEQPPSYDHPQIYDRGLTSGPPATLDRSLPNRRAPMDDFRRHEHDSNCNHDHGTTDSRRELFDRSPSNNVAPRDYPSLRQQFNTQQHPRSDQPISEGPPPLPPQG